MSDYKKMNGREELGCLENALIQSILDANGDELRTEIRESGDDPDEYIALANDIISRVQERYAKERLERAKAEAKAFQEEGKRSVISFESAKGRVGHRSTANQSSSPLMLAARKGKELSERDQDALLRAQEMLRKLESKDKE
jgi:hypothetical protein